MKSPYKGAAVSSINFKATFLFALFVSGHAAYAQSAHFSGAQANLPIGGLTNPYGMTVDSAGNVYIADLAQNSIIELGTTGFLAGGGSLTVGEGNPYGIAVDAKGAVYFSDKVRNKVTKETPVPFGGYDRSTLPISGLSSPLGIAVDLHGNVYIADSLNNRIVRGTPTGSSYTESVVATSTLSLPMGVAVDAYGNLYIADSFHARIVKETVNGSGWTESIVADLSSYGSSNLLPIGVASDAAGDVFILLYQDDENFAVLKETLSGGTYTQSSIPSFGQNPYSIAADAAGDVFLASPGGNRLLKEFASSVNFPQVPVTASSSPITFTFTMNAATTVGAPAVVTRGNAGLDFTNAKTGSCGTKSTSYQAGNTCTVNVVFSPKAPGVRYGAVVLKDGSGNTIASVDVPGTGEAPQLTFLPGSQVFVATGGSTGLDPAGVAVDAVGNVFFADSRAGEVYEEALSFSAAGNYIFSKTTIASGLIHPTAVALDGAGNVYVATSNVVYKEAPSAAGYVASEIVSNLSGLNGIAVDGFGNLYLTSSTTGNVHKETLKADGSYAESSIGFGITSPRAIATDGSGNLYVGDASGEIDRVARQSNGSYVETEIASDLGELAGLAVDGSGNVYYADITAGHLTMLQLSAPPVINFATTKPGSTSPDSPRRVTLSNIGNVEVDFPSPGFGSNPSIATGAIAFSLSAGSTCPVVAPFSPVGPLHVGSSCYYGIGFTPHARMPYQGSLQLVDTNMNAFPDATQSVMFQGKAATADATRTTMRVTPNPVKTGLGVTMTVTVTDTTASSTVVTGGVSFTDSVNGMAALPLNGGVAVALSGGKAVLTMAAAVAGTHVISAHYNGVDNSFVGSTGQVTLTVQ